MADPKDKNTAAPAVDPIARGVADQNEILGLDFENDRKIILCDRTYGDLPQSPACNAFRKVVRGRGGWARH